MLVTVNSLLSHLRLDALTTLMSAYAASGRPLQGAIDGGAGAGAITKQMLAHIGGMVYAFEPFPGNHPFFMEHERVALHKAALAREASVAKLYVSSMVTESSGWGRQGLAGYSSMGYLLDEYKSLDLEKTPPEKLFDVPCVAADEVIPSDQAIDLVKLDLQGGELNALRGMQRITQRARMLWIEYTGQRDLAPYLIEQGFTLFETEYFFIGSPNEILEKQFAFTKRDVELSTGSKAQFGFWRGGARPDYERWFQSARKEHNLIQTDLVCIHRDRLAEFVEVLGMVVAKG